MSVYPPPKENVPIFNPLDYATNDTAITKEYADNHYVQYPVAQGFETFTNTLNEGDATVEGNIYANSNIILAGTYLKYPDLTQQTSAYTGAKALAGSYTNTNMTVDANGKITALSNGSGGSSAFTLTSNAVGTNSWVFTIPNSYGRAFTFSLYTDTTPTNSARNGLTIPMNYGNVGLNGGFIYATGNAVYQPYSATSQTQITYCAGFQQQYTISAGGGGYVMNIINSMGGVFSIAITTSSVGQNTTPCPPTASGGFTTIYTITSSVSVASCNLKLVGQVVAS